MSRSEGKLAKAQLQSQLDIQSQEVARVQGTISQQLGVVMKRQQGLEAINLKLRERADIAKQKLEEFEYEEEENSRLCRLRTEDMSLFEYAQFAIYKHIKPEKIRTKNLEMEVE